MTDYTHGGRSGKRERGRGKGRKKSRIFSRKELQEGRVEASPSLLFPSKSLAHLCFLAPPPPPPPPAASGPEKLCLGLERGWKGEGRGWVEGLELHTCRQKKKKERGVITERRFSPLSLRRCARAALLRNIKFSFFGPKA